VDYLATILASDTEHTWEIGPLGHGLHALALYDQRIFRPQPIQPSPSEPEPAKLAEPLAEREKPILEVAEKPSLFDRPACRIGNDDGELAPPPGKVGPVDPDDEGCL
jgi:hypothetical protein